MIRMPLPLHGTFTSNHIQSKKIYTYPLQALHRTFLSSKDTLGCTISSPLFRPPFRLLLL
uniref:Uncharacterized protein n=1 Tax=Astyanax mexicanus TaxID=7994 RepID=A0A8B9J8H3_ASTMX